MVDDIVNYIRDALEFVFMSGGYVQVIIAVVVALVGGFLLEKLTFNGLVNKTFLALVVFVLALAVVNYIDTKPESLGDWAQDRMNVFLGFTLGQILTAFVAFAIVIAIAHLLRGAVMKKG